MHKFTFGTLRELGCGDLRSGEILTMLLETYIFFNVNQLVGQPAFTA